MRTKREEMQEFAECAKKRRLEIYQGYFVRKCSGWTNRGFTLFRVLHNEYYLSITLLNILFVYQLKELPKHLQ